MYKDSTQDEARRLLFQKLPNFTFKWVTEEEDRKSFASPTVRMNTPKPTDVGCVSNSVLLLIGKKPTKVSKIHDSESEFF